MVSPGCHWDHSSQKRDGAGFPKPVVRGGLNFPKYRGTALLLGGRASFPVPGSSEFIIPGLRFRPALKKGVEGVTPGQRGLGPAQQGPHISTHGSTYSLIGPLWCHRQQTSTLITAVARRWTRCDPGQRLGTSCHHGGCVYTGLLNVYNMAPHGNSYARQLHSTQWKQKHEPQHRLWARDSEMTSSHSLGQDIDMVSGVSTDHPICMVLAVA